MVVWKIFVSYSRGLCTYAIQWNRFERADLNERDRFSERESSKRAVFALSLSLSLSPSVEKYRKRWNPFESGDRDPRRPFLLATKEKKKRSKTARPNRVKVHSSIFPFFHSRIPLFSNDTFNHVVISPPSLFSRCKTLMIFTFRWYFDKRKKRREKINSCMQRLG